MLIEFRVENHRSIRDEQALTMEAGLPDDGADTRPRVAEGHNEKLLPVAVLYGANASGKTNVLAALDFMREAVSLSHRAWEPDGGVPRNPFAWGPKRGEPSSFIVTALLGGTRYEYGFVASDEAFLEEWLFAWPHGKKQVWFERENGSFKFGDNLKGEHKTIEGLTRPNSLFLSAAVQNGHEMLARFARWFRSLQPLNLRSLRSIDRERDSFRLARRMISDQQPSLFPDDKLSMIDQFRALLRDADVGIVDVRVQSDETKGGFRGLKLEFCHTTDLNGWLTLDEESKGTQTLVSIAPHILDALEGGGTLLVDELEASLHPMLAAQIVKQFNDPKTNPKNAQLIFTTHDTNLLGTALGGPILRRDQVWFTEKDKEGASVLYPLTDYKPRKEENLERGYLQGRYGAIPFLGNLSFSGEASDGPA